MPDTTQWIVYACPQGPLAEQVERFYAESLDACGPNRAHDYMPHCTLTGFFRDVSDAAPRYIAALEEAFYSESVDRSRLTVTITGMPLLLEWLGLTLEAEAIRERVAAFARLADTSTRTEAIRLKDNLHLSLAYEFAPEQYATLAALARKRMDITRPVTWELRLYERRSGNQWTCHYSRPLP